MVINSKKHEPDKPEISKPTTSRSSQYNEYRVNEASAVYRAASVLNAKETSPPDNINTYNKTAYQQQKKIDWFDLSDNEIINDDDNNNIQQHKISHVKNEDNRYRRDDDKRSNNNRTNSSRNNRFNNTMANDNKRQNNSNRENQRNFDHGKRYNNQKNEQRFDETRLSLKLLEDLLEKTPEKIVLSLLDPRLKFDKYFDAETMGDKMVFMLLSLIEKAFECNSIKTRLRPKIERVVDSKFFTDHVYRMVFKNGYDYEYHFLKSLLNLCSKFMYLNPHCYVQLEPLIDSIEYKVAKNYKHSSDNELNDLLNEAKKTKTDAKSRVENYKFQTFSNKIDYSNLPPPNDFTLLSIVPQLNDILFNNELYLRKNVTNGSYDDVNHYLDVQFRLLREDFMLPLREGVSKLRDLCKNAKFNG